METNFQFTVEGVMWVKVQNVKTKAKFKEVIKLPTKDRALSIIQKQVIGPLLAKKHENYIKWHTCEITHDEEIGPNKSKPRQRTDLAAIPTMNREELREVCINEGLDVIVEKIGSVAEARQVVQDAYDDKRNAEHQRKEDAKDKAKKAKEKAAILKANGIPSEDEFSKDV